MQVELSVFLFFLEERKSLQLHRATPSRAEPSRAIIDKISSSFRTDGKWMVRKLLASYPRASKGDEKKHFSIWTSAYKVH